MWATARSSIVEALPEVGPTIVICGPSGCGKSTLGSALAKRLGRPFLEGDEFHPLDNIQKMTAGIALTDADRAPWLAAIAQAILDLRANGQAPVVACSALGRSHREVLSSTGFVQFIHLRVPPKELAIRLSKRSGHFFREELLQSQLSRLEPPAEALTLDGTLEPVVLLDAAYRGLRPMIS